MLKIVEECVKYGDTHTHTHTGRHGGADAQGEKPRQRTKCGPHAQRKAVHFISILCPWERKQSS